MASARRLREARAAWGGGYGPGGGDGAWPAPEGRGLAGRGGAWLCVPCPAPAPVPVPVPAPVSHGSVPSDMSRGDSPLLRPGALGPRIPAGGPAASEGIERRLECRTALCCWAWSM